MITRDGAHVFTETYSMYTRVEEIIYMSGFNLCGLSSVSDVTMLLKNDKTPLVLKYNSLARKDLFDAARLFGDTHKESPFLIFKDGTIVNVFELTHTCFSKTEEEDKHTTKLFFKDGTMVTVSPFVFGGVCFALKEFFMQDAKTHSKQKA